VEAPFFDGLYLNIMKFLVMIRKMNIYAGQEISYTDSNRQGTEIFISHRGLIRGRARDGNWKLSQFHTHGQEKI